MSILIWVVTIRTAHGAGCGAVADLQFKMGKVTVSRLSSKAEEAVVFTADMIDKIAYQGSSGWIKNFKMQGKKLDLKELLSVIYNYRVDHHMTFGYGDNEDAYLEFANWKKLKIAAASQYAPYLQSRG